MKTQNIKNFIEEGEKEFEEKFTYMGRNQADQLDMVWNGRVTIPSMKQFISSRQISLIKMIVEEYGDWNNGCGCCSDGTLLKDELKELIK